MCEKAEFSQYCSQTWESEQESKTNSKNESEREKKRQREKKHVSGNETEEAVEGPGGADCAWGRKQSWLSV